MMASSLQTLQRVSVIATCSTLLSQEHSHWWLLLGTLFSCSRWKLPCPSQRGAGESIWGGVLTTTLSLFQNTLIMRALFLQNWNSWWNNMRKVILNNLFSIVYHHYHLSLSLSAYLTLASHSDTRYTHCIFLSNIFSFIFSWKEDSKFHSKRSRSSLHLTFSCPQWG